MAKKTETKKARIAREIASCADRQHRITPDAVVERARDPQSVLHNEFEWDDALAAKQARLDRARELIREVRVMVEVEEVRISAPFYVVDPSAKSPAYKATTLVARKREDALEVLRDELSRVVGALNRGTSLSLIFGLQDRWQAMLSEAAELKKILDGDVPVVKRRRGREDRASA